MTSQCDLTLYFPKAVMLNTFSLIFCHPYILFGKMSLHVICQSSNLAFNGVFEKSLYMLDMSPLPALRFVQFIPLILT